MSEKTNYNYENKPFYLQLKAFKSRLQKQQYSPATIRQLSNYAGNFLDWLGQRGLETTAVSYTDIMDFIDYCRKDSIRLVNRKLGAIRKYYDYLQYEGETEKNPASGIYLKGRRSSVPHGLLDRESLDRLYENYHVTDERTQRNKVILGLLIFQGLTNEELHKLEPEDIKLKAGEIEVPGGSKTKGRTLKLESHQILELHEYINITRPAILAKVYAYDHKEPFYRPGRKPDQVNRTRLNRQLFISMNGSTAIKSSIRHLIRALQQINPEVKSATQIRQSVIAGWLKVKPLRTVQYMAGHRHVGATERYRLHHLKALQEQLDIYHPLEGEPHP